MAAVPLGKRALLSVTDKSGLAEVGRALQRHGYELVASGGTAAYLRDNDIPATEVSDLTGFPEIFAGRVKTLHPVIHGGILGPDHESFGEVADMGIAPIDVVVVNLYDFEAAVAGGADEAAGVEKIDIGGPTLLRAAAKNFQRVTVLSDPAFYGDFLAELDAHEGTTTLEFRRRMAGAVFARVARYNQAITDWLGAGDGIGLRYGEYPHQSATLQLPGNLSLIHI